MRGRRYKSVFQTSARKRNSRKCFFFVQENCFKYTGLNIKIHHFFSVVIKTTLDFSKIFSKSQVIHHDTSINRLIRIDICDNFCEKKTNSIVEKFPPIFQRSEQK